MVTIVTDAYCEHVSRYVEETARNYVNLMTLYICQGTCRNENIDKM